jgi:hypothetical protein
MNMTRHATTRSQQRAIPPMMIDLLIQFGTSESAGSGVSKVFFDKQACRRVSAYAGPLAASLNEHMDLYAVVADDRSIVTVGHRQERIRRY